MPVHAHGRREGLGHAQLRGREEIVARVEGHGPRGLKAREKARSQRLHSLLPALQQHVKMVGLGRAHAWRRIVAEGGPVHDDHLVEVGRYGAGREEPGQAAPQHEGPIP